MSEIHDVVHLGSRHEQGSSRDDGADYLGDQYRGMSGDRQSDLVSNLVRKNWRGVDNGWSFRRLGKSDYRQIELVAGLDDVRKSLHESDHREKNGIADVGRQNEDENGEKKVSEAYNCILRREELRDYRHEGICNPC